MPLLAPQHRRGTVDETASQTSEIEGDLSLHLSLVASMFI